jgi:hypothetical protein
MKPWIKVLLVTLVVAVPAFVLGPVLFPPAEVGIEPTAGQIPYFILLAVWDAVFLGLGVAFLLFGMPVLRKVSPDSSVRAWVMYLSVGFLTVSWWPHLNMHASNGIDFQGLLYIDYGFHVPLMISAAALIYCFISIARRRTKREPAYTVVRGPVDAAPLAESQVK